MTSSNAPSSQPMSRRAGGPCRPSIAELSTLTSRTTRTPSGRRPSRPVLRFPALRLGLLVRQLIAGPAPFEQIQPEIPPQGLLDDLAVPPSRARGPDLHGAEHALVDRERRSDLRQRGIIAS